MYTATFTRANAAYKRVAADTLVDNASPRQLVHMLYQEVLNCVSVARGAIARKEIEAKGVAIGRAVRLIAEGLKPGLNMADGGELAGNLSAVYDYCLMQLTRANANNDDACLQEVRSLIEPIAKAWQEMNPQAGA